MGTRAAIIAVVTAISAIAAACEKFISEYDVEIHISRVWAVDDELPERLTR